MIQRDVDRGCASKVSFSPRGNVQASNYLLGARGGSKACISRESLKMEAHCIASQAASIRRARPPRQSIEIKRLGIGPCPCLALASVGRVLFLGADEEGMPAKLVEMTRCDCLPEAMCCDEKIGHGGWLL